MLMLAHVRGKISTLSLSHKPSLVTVNCDRLQTLSISLCYFNDSQCFYYNTSVPQNVATATSYVETQLCK